MHLRKRVIRLLSPCGLLLDVKLWLGERTEAHLFTICRLDNIFVNVYDLKSSHFLSAACIFYWK